MEKYCSILPNELTAINKQINEITNKLKQKDETFRPFYKKQIEKLFEKREELIKNINICQKDWAID